MTRRHVERLAILFVLTSGFAFASSQQPEVKLDISGTWKWMMQRPNGAGREVTLTLRQDGDKITGSVSGMGGETEIKEASFKDGQLMFQVTRSRGGTETTTTYQGKFEGDSIKGKAETDTAGRKVPRDWEAHRVKEEKPKAGD